MTSYVEKVLVAAVLSLIVLTGPLAALTSSPATQDSSLMLVIGRDASAIVRQAGGQVVGPVTAPLAVFATGDGTLLHNLTLSGAWRVLDARRFAFLCS
ncbi:hypothetical protein Z946_4031 [Sulfitobacter noctilucicola]|uniref:Uncharacterized protein n=1 Tax=Sulfitobacter noctilucicola TaxID=1342301 RepID=A0A7W6M7Y4_9RHOB|nr:hypothetical protein [Sulfitobacter noctilucicola]KIN65131.1 hypothetical protein Z946_4031 [Sulfitobacter noctilucicola]MBB4173733.1 hypothetical protein [Sulfitobacter noctilucicola]